jgi:hypothetical protein
MIPSQHIENGADQLREGAFIVVRLGIGEVVHGAVFVVKGNLRACWTSACRACGDWDTPGRKLSPIF